MGGGICGAKRRDGGICQNAGMGNGRCRMHGGASVSGVDHPGFRHGRYSSSDHLAAKMERLGIDVAGRANDPALMDVRRPAAIQEYIVTHLTEMAANNETPEWRGIVWGEFNEAVELLDKDYEQGRKALKRVGNLIERGANKTAALKHLEAANQNMVSIQSAYWGAALKAKESISREEFAGALFRLVDIIEGEMDLNAANRVLERADEEIFGGLLGLSQKQASD